MNDRDKEALKERLSSMGFPDENSYLVYHKAWKAACDFKQKEIDELKDRLIKEARSELERKDKRILELEKECTRLFDPTRKFWDEDYRESLVKLQAENVKLNQEVDRLKKELIYLYEATIDCRLAVHRADEIAERNGLK